MILEAIGISALMSGLMIGSGVKWGTMSDKKKIEKILDYTKTFVVNEKKEVKKCVFVRKEDILNDEEKRSAPNMCIACHLDYLIRSSNF